MTGIKTPVRPQVATSANGAGQARRAGLPTARVCRVLVVDALPLASVGLRAVIDSGHGLASCGSTSSIATAITAVGHLRPDIVLVDSGFDTGGKATRALLAAAPGITVIGVVRDDAAGAAYVRTAIDHGVRGMVSRSAAPATVISIIHGVRAGNGVVDPSLSPLIEGKRPQGKTLSERQLTVLELIACGRSTDSIAQTLFVSVETIRTHVKAVLVRLGARDRAHAVARGYQLGLLGLPDAQRRPAEGTDARI